MELRKVTFRKKGRIQGLGSLADEFVQKDKKHRQVFNDAEHRHAIRPHHACQHMDGYQGKDTPLADSTVVEKVSASSLRR